MRKSVAAHCPYCGKMINYFYLYDAKRSDFGYCSHCGGMYAVKYSPLAYMLVMGVIGALLGSFAFWYLANKTLPGADYLLICTAVTVGLYFLLPLLITPRRVIVRGRLGGFPSPEYIPVHRRDRKRAGRKLAVKHRPEVLQPVEKEGEHAVRADHTASDAPGKARRTLIPRRARRYYPEKDQPSKPKVVSHSGEKKKNKNGIFSAVRTWTGQLTTLVCAWGKLIGTAAGNVCENAKRWWKQCFRKREKPGKGQ